MEWSNARLPTLTDLPLPLPDDIKLKLVESFIILDGKLVEIYDVDWDELMYSTKFTNDLIVKYIDSMDRILLFRTQNLPESFIITYVDFDNDEEVATVCRFQKLSESFIEKYVLYSTAFYLGNSHMYLVAKYQELSETFIEDHILEFTHFIIRIISVFQKLSESFIYKYIHILDDNLDVVCSNQYLSETFIEENIDKFANYMHYIYASRQRRLQVYKNSCKSRGFEPNESVFWKLIHINCVYCGKHPVEGYANLWIPYELNGVDRIDSTKGYTTENCVACCDTCNYMKNNADICSFIRKCCEIHKVPVGDYRLAYHSNRILCGNSSSFKGYKAKAKTRNISFELSKEEFQGIVSQRCSYCDKTNHKGIIGVDRIDSSRGYCTDNVVACCSYCNYMKKDQSVEQFLEKVKTIVEYTGNNERILSLCETNSSFSPMFTATDESTRS